jgi:antitoxin (DNA-binding transcriptional repressor) of toxin-antitoxin stability system
LSITVGELQHNAAEHLRRIAETGRAEAITRDGHFVAVLCPAPPADLVEQWVTGEHAPHLVSLEGGIA